MSINQTILVFKVLRDVRFTQSSFSHVFQRSSFSFVHSGGHSPFSPSGSAWGGERKAAVGVYVCVCTCGGGFGSQTPCCQPCRSWRRKFPPEKRLEKRLVENDPSVVSLPVAGVRNRQWF